MRINQFDLLDFLNYDSNTRQFLTPAERIFLHQQIARMGNQLAAKDLPEKLQNKLIERKKIMRETQWKYVQVRVSQDRKIERI
ncbi:hypothetical protein MSHRCOH1_03420 [Candidatus Ornithobacterium hominis]|uniref:hypothetical protein n=1 Tax=Candidatus Ornithobacterium hominis TaxID=2497989 RepID=UPI0024BC85EC|nr:hypothetical protein [Candidatus Ornithobacterium hominis]CAI9429238.1 hypothetical protein MSHRCOH1_03420 [Candidatus Ornithobacterium hominis]